MIYILDHYHAKERLKYCSVVESDKTVQEVVEICNTITFLLEELSALFAPVMKYMLEILISFYGMTDKTAVVSYNSLTAAVASAGDNFGVFKMIALSDEEGLLREPREAYIVDLCEARKSCHRDEYQEIMDKWLPEGEELVKMRKIMYCLWEEDEELLNENTNV